MTLTSRTTHESDTSTQDVHGWDVYNRTDDDRVGKVDDVLIDESGGTRYLSVSLNGGDGERVLVPSGHVSRDRSRERVWVEGVSVQRLRSLPTYSGRPASVDEEYEQRLWTSWEEQDEQARYDRPEYQGRGWGAGREEPSGQRVERVGRLDDVGVASDDPDPRGWRVMGADGQDVGEVDHLLGDTDRMRVVYLVVELDHEIADEERHVLVPVGHARLDRDNERVHVDSLERARFAELEPYQEEHLEREHEERVLGTHSAAYTGDRRYEHPRFRDEGLGEGSRSERESPAATR